MSASLVLIHVLFQLDLSTLDGVNHREDVAQYVSTVSSISLRAGSGSFSKVLRIVWKKIINIIQS